MKRTRFKVMAVTAAMTFATSLGMTSATATPASAAGCILNTFFMGEMSTGRVNPMIVVGPYGYAYTSGCTAVSVTVTATPADVGGPARLVTPGSCAYPEPAGPVLGPNEAYCGPLGGYGSFAFTSSTIRTSP